MSYFGQNIKKIRVAKKLSQSDFAKLFGLTRSAVGAYEEGRAEAKIDKIVEIANYFRIDLTKFLTKKLTVNEILHFDEKSVTNAVNTIFVGIPFIEKSKFKQYLKNSGNPDYISRIPHIVLPDVNENYRAFEYSDKRHFLDGDILICSKYDNHRKQNDIFLLISEDEMQVSEKIPLKKKFWEIWRVEFVLTKQLNKINTNKLLLDLHRKLDTRI